MTRLADIQAKIDSIGELRDIIGAMRSLSGMRVQEAQRALPGVRRYAEAVEAALASTLLLMREPAPRPAARGRRALVLCTSEHGFVGGFNERLIADAKAWLGPEDALLVLGSRGAALASERLQRPAWTHPTASRCAGAPGTIRPLLNELYRGIALGALSRVEVMFARYRQGSAPAIERRLLLPLDVVLLSAKQPRQPPLHTLEPIPLHEKLMAEYVFALLTEAVVESIASENAARFAAMGSAHDNVSKKLEELYQEARQARQLEITTELIDLITGAEALTNG
ncbi:F0F1 ATP synthase subunit gamma [Methylosinus sp. LW3]|uniref:F0F1 ATP synthase subunit gamma n=1 Tax=Methylosinus sp. LW3 TaxID=107635 RepID=UPI000466FC13|nr:F0F1 ATP synthase subunit gamma [Methylosinus sp. LW3]